MSNIDDEFVPVKGQNCPYGGWCHTCFNKLMKETDNLEQFLRDYPGSSRAYHGDPNFCKAHQDEKIKYESQRQKLSQF